MVCSAHSLPISMKASWQKKKLDRFHFLSVQVAETNLSRIVGLLFTSISSKRLLQFSDSTRGPFLLWKFNNSMMSKRYILVFICFLATILTSASFFVVNSCCKHLGWNQTSSLLNLGFYRAMKHSDNRDGTFLVPEDVTESDLGSNSEALEHQILEQQNSGVDNRKWGRKSCSVDDALLRIYMYDLPPEFHFGMFRARPVDQPWPTNATEIPRYPGGLNQQHSPEYWLTVDLLTSTFPDRHTPCTAVRVKEPKLADAFFVPYFSSLSYNKYSRVGHGQADLNEVLQQKLVNRLLRQTAWKDSGGRNHIIPMHHPNSLQLARESLRNATFIVADFGRYSKQVANIAKDVVAPYKHILPYFYNDNTSFYTRHILLFFQGAIVRKEGGIIRQKLHELLKDEGEVHFLTGNTQRNGIRSATQGMRSSKFCLHLAGDTPSSNRLFDAIASHCVPVIISDEIELPFEDQLDYSDFCLFVRSSDALKRGFLLKLLKSITSNEWTSMWRKLHEVGHHFEYLHPTEPDDAVHMTWKAISKKVSSINLLIHKAKRYRRSRRVH